MNRRELLKSSLAVSAALNGLRLRASPPSAEFGTGPGAFPLPAVYEVSVEYFPGHSLRELTAHIPHIADLGAPTIYITPIFTCAGLAQYLILDYYAINPRYGTAADLKALVNSAHARGIRVLLDMVTSLTTEGSFIMKEHPQWRIPGDDGKPQRYYPFPAWGWALDGANPQLIRYFSDLAAWYVREYDIDGWRIDSPMNNYDPAKVSSDHSRMNLLRAMKRAVLRAKPTAYFMAEVSGPEVLWGKSDRGAQPLFDEMCEGSYSYKYCGFLGPAGKTGGMYVTFDGSPNVVPPRRTTLDRVVHGELTSSEFVDSVRHEPILYNRLRVNFIENHDTARVSALFPQAHRAMFILIASMPGVPVIHAGQEVGSKVHPDASGNTKIVVNWGAGDHELEAFYKRVVRVRTANRALCSSEITNVWNSGDKALGFLRTAGGNRMLVALNFGAEPARFDVSIPARSGVTLTEQLSGTAATHSRAELARLPLHLEPWGYRIFSIADAHHG